MADRKKSKQKERLLREEVAAEGNVIPDIGFEDEKLQRALHSSREEAQFARAAREGGGDNMSTMVVHLNNKVAWLEGCGDQARKGRKALPCKQGLTQTHGQ
jgi:serine/threonine protein phosphatase PrpC